MTPEEKALRDAFLSEMWKPCRELSREEREAKRIGDEIARAQAVENAAEIVDRGPA